MTSQPTANDLWAWIDEEPEGESTPQINPADVTAVMVVHNAAEWLPRQLRALSQLNPRPGRLIVVDNGSTDNSRPLLQQAYDHAVVSQLVAGHAHQSFGQAVASALPRDAAWIWLLHDDSAPHPDALGQLLRGAARTGAGILVPKLLQPRRRNYPETLAEVGQSITPTGRRVGTVEEGDIDQGQETSQAILGGSTAGMLIRGDVWRHLGGLAPELPLHRDGVDLGWRANEAGYTVLTWPDAALTHRQSGRTGERKSSLAEDTHEMDRLAALRVVASRGAKPAPMLRLVVGSWLRAAGFLLAKSPRLAKAELRAAKRFSKSQDQVVSLAARTAPDRADISALLPNRWWPLRNAFDRFGANMAERYRDFTTPETGLSIDEMTGDDFAGGPTRRRLLAPLSLLTIVLVVAGALASRTLFGAGEVFGGGILPSPANLTQAWQNALSPVVGVEGPAAPWLSLAAMMSVFTAGSGQALVFLAITLTPLLAGLSAHGFLRCIDVPRTTAAVLAGVWAGAVILLGLVTAGDIAGMVLAIVLPRIASGVHRMYLDPSSGAESFRAPAAAAAWLVIGAAVWPALALLAFVSGVIWVIRDHRMWLRVGIAVTLPIGFLAPWVPTLVRWPGRLLTGSDPMAWPTWSPADAALAAGRILPSGLPLWANLGFFGVVALASSYATCALKSSRQRWMVLGTIAVPLLLGVLASRLAVEVNGGNVRPLLSGWSLLTLAALLVPVGVLRLRDERPRIDVKGMLSLLTAGGIMAAGTWAFFGFAGPVTSRASQLSYMADVVASIRQTRVLMIETQTGEGLTWNVVEAAQPSWGTGERNPAGGFHQEYATLVQLVSGGDAPEDLADQLSSLGISHVWMRGFSADQLAAVGNAAGLSRGATDDDAVVWTVVDLPARARLASDSGTAAVLDGQVTAADHERQLVLAEPADSRWSAKIGDVTLTRTSDESVVAFDVPAGLEGQLSWELRPATGALIWQVAIAVMIGGLAAPTIGGASAARRGMED